MKVVSLDLDGTLVHPAIFNVVADALGFGEPLQKSYAAYVAGTMSLEEAFWHDWKHFVGRPVQPMRDVLKATPHWTPGIRDAIDALHAEGLRVIVTTDQPRFLAEATRDLGVDWVVCSEAPAVDGRVPEAVDARFAKWPNLERWLEREGVDPADVAHVGNGTNDIPVFQRVGYSVAVNPSAPAVSNAADATVDPLRDLRDVADLLLARHAATRE